VSACARSWSPAQEAVFAAVANPGGHLVIEALAGTGKTTTIVEALTHTHELSSALMCAFNKSIATELAGRVPTGVEVSTLHSFGLRAVTRALGRREIDNGYVGTWLRQRVSLERGERVAVGKLVSAAKATLAWMPSELDALADTFGIDLEPHRRKPLLQIAAQVLEHCRTQEAVIDFDDMIWLPIVRDLEVDAYDWVFVDETQDLNPAQLALVRKAGAEGRIVAVGDRRQAIYGFRGADKQAIPRMIAELSAQVLPLNITYRCPRSVVTEAQRLVPALEAAPNAPEGIVRAATYEELRARAEPGDFVISRLNAPLISLCFKWLAAGRRAAIKGRDVGAGLLSWIRGTHASSVRELLGELASWQHREVERLQELERDLTPVTDRAECIRALCEGAATVRDVEQRIERLFVEAPGEGAITLTSTHRAKGLEADRVWMLADTYRDKGIEELNLQYVAITRSKRELIYVSGQGAA
jgi:DNA helicase-2/ATP-dependent DNA helicase PcrA